MKLNKSFASLLAFLLVFASFALEAIPSITGLFPSSGSVAGGRSVTISGSGFTGVTVVNFGKQPAPSFEIISDSTIHVTTPLYVPCTVPVTVFAPPFTSSPSNHFTFTGNNYLYNLGFESLIPINLDTNTVETGIALPFGSEGFALTPDGYYAYVYGLSRGLGLGIVPVNLASRTVGAQINVGQIYEAYTIAIAADGLTGYLLVDNLEFGTSQAIPLNLLDNTLNFAGVLTYNKSSPFQKAQDLLVSPNGSTVYLLIGVAQQSFETCCLVSFDTVSATEIASLSFPEGIHINGMSLSPDGNTIYITNSSAIVVTSVDVSTPSNPTIIASSAALPIASAYEIAVSPDGTKAFVTDGSGGTQAVNISVSPPVAISPTMTASDTNLGVTVSPDGGSVFVQGQDGPPYSVYEYSTSDNTLVETFMVYDTAFSIPPLPNTIKAAPGQFPVANFTLPSPTEANLPVTFDASASLTPTGTITNYYWDFGDSNTASVSSPTVTHTYTNAGSYLVALTVTNSLGVSTSQVYTGQTVNRNGSLLASTSATYVATTPNPPTVTAISPAAGPGYGTPNTSVVITGTNFLSATGVQFGGTPAQSFVVNSSTQITAVSPNLSPRIVDVTVVNPGGTSATSTADKYTYYSNSIPVIASISPASGSTSGGTSVTITGSHFLSTTSALFGSTAGTDLSVVSDSLITATSPAAFAGTVDIRLTNNNGVSIIVPADEFTYISPPSVTSVSPNNGYVDGGTSVTITGSGFTGTTAVDFDLNAAPDFTVVSDSEITATSPPGFLGTVDITVTNPVGTSLASSDDQFTYTDVPLINTVTPNSGSVFGGNTVIITGTSFTGTTSVTFGGVSASYSITDDSTLSVTVPAYLSGPFNVDIVVTNAIGSSTNGTGAYTYVNVLAVTWISPNTGSVSGGTTVIISGNDFVGVSAVKFGSVSATSYTVDSSTQITAQSPAQSAGTVYVTVSAGGATSAPGAANLYTYTSGLSLPTVTDVSVRSGPASGGTVIDLTGTGFTGVSSVSFGPQNAPTFMVNSDTSITVTSPVYVPATVHITVKNDIGISPTTEADYFVYTGNYMLYSLGNAGLIPVNTGVPNTLLPAISYGFMDPNGLALSPTGDKAYVLGVTLADGPVILPIDLTTGTTMPFITGLSMYELYNIAVAPDNKNLYVSVENFYIDRASILPFSVETLEVGTEMVASTIPPDINPYGVLVSSDGNTAYLLIGFTGSPSANSTLLCFDIPSSTQVGSCTFISTVMDGMTLSPDGNTIYITQSSPMPVVNVVDVSDRTAPALVTTTSTLTMLTNAYGIAVSPDGTLAFVTDYNTNVQAVDLMMSPPSPTLAYQALAGSLGVCVSPDGAYVYTQDTTEAFGVYSISQLHENNLNFNSYWGASDSTFALPPLPDSLKITPDQAPLALFTVTPAAANSATEFNASASVSPTGSIASYLWDFGDSSTGTGVTPSHTYVRAGTYNVTLTVTNTAGTSTTQVTTGQTLSLNGGPSAVSMQAVKIPNPPPAVNDVSPNSGPTFGGTSVTLTGTDFTGATAVNFGGNPATSYSVLDSTLIIATAPAGVAGTTNVSVSTPQGTSPTGIVNQYTYVTAPTVDSLSSNTGPIAGGASVVITGTNFTGVTEVNFGTTSALSYTVDSDTQITVTTPAHIVGVINVSVTGTGGTSAPSSGNEYTYVAAPTVIALSPTVGPTSGGTTVILTGTNFIGVSSVTFGPVAAVSYVVNSPTQITATSPVAAAGTVSVVVTATGGTSTTGFGNLYTYIAAPAVFSISPTVGPLAGGTIVTINGANFNGTTVVKFGTINATSFIVNSSIQITALAPAGVAGIVNVTVTTPGGISSPASGNQYTYVGLPVVTSVEPNSGPTAGGTLVIITGLNFTGATSVIFGSTNATSINVINSTTIGAVVPAGVVGTVNVTVTTPGGKSAISPASQYTYVAVPTVTGLSPNSGPIVGGTSVVLTGTNFTGVTSVKFGTVNVTSYSILNSTTIATVAPPDSAGIVNVTVTGPGGTSSATPANKYTYVTIPTVTALSPNFGPTVGGESVVITGTNFTGVTSVKFGSINATSFSIVGSTTIAAVAPPGVIGTVNVTVTNPEGTSIISSASQYTYVGAPTVTGLSPNAGPLDAGTAVVITGTNFSGATSVRFGLGEAIAFNVNSPTQISAFAPAGTAGVVNVTVTTPEGTSVINVSSQYTYVDVPTVTALSPNSGSIAGVTSVVLTGTNLTGASIVWFGSKAAFFYSVLNSTTILAVAPLGLVGTINVTVTTPGGTSDIGVGNEYTYD